LGRPPKDPNGAFVDDVIEAARQRLEFYQKASNGRFACRENAIAITKLEEALHWLYARRMEREIRGVQGELDVDFTKYVPIWCPLPDLKARVAEIVKRLNRRNVGGINPEWAVCDKDYQEIIKLVAP